MRTARTPLSRRSAGPLRLLAGTAAAVVLATSLAACGDDGSDGSAGGTDDAGSGSSQETGSGAEPTEPTEDADAALDPALVEQLTAEYLGQDQDCPNGAYEDVDDLLTTLGDKLAKQATSLRSWYCGGLIDQAVLAEMPDAETAALALDDETTGYYAWTFVSGTSVLAVNKRVAQEGGVDVKAFFDDLAEQCGCGETLYEG